MSMTNNTQANHQLSLMIRFLLMMANSLKRLFLEGTQNREVRFAKTAILYCPLDEVTGLAIAEVVRETKSKQDRRG